MAEKIVVSGFERFGANKEPNPSSEVVLPALRERYAGLVATVVLPVAYDTALDTLKGTIREVWPEAIVLFGLSQRPDPFRLEVRARNWRESKHADNLGQHFHGRIIDGMPEYLDSTLPLEQIAEEMDNREVPYTWSDDAHTFVCNDTFYQALHYAKRLNATEHVPAISTGLIHFGRELTKGVVEEGAYATIEGITAKSPVDSKE
jgi:pyroglutamyl-peptidase